MSPYFQHRLLPLLTLLQLWSLVGGKNTTLFDPFCVEDTVYQPYLKYYHGRQDALRRGLPFRTHPPGFWNDIRVQNLRNVYVCVNGPAWLYFKVTTSRAVVYEAPELHLFIHQCFMANGKHGPGPHTTNKTLEGILLLGQKEDYRKPLIQFFVAPWMDPVTKVVTNVTSVMIIGDDTECILLKGPQNTPIRIRTQLPELAPTGPPENGTVSYCTLAYQNIDKHIVTPARRRRRSALLNLEHDLTDSEFLFSFKGDGFFRFKRGTPQEDVIAAAKSALSNDESIKVKLCDVAANFTATTADIIKKRKAQIDGFEVAGTGADPGGDLHQLKKETYFKAREMDKPEDLPYIPTATAPVPDPTVGFDPEKIQTKIQEIEAITNKTDPGFATKDKDLLGLKMQNYIKAAFDQEAKMVEAYLKVKEIWTKLDTRSTEFKNESWTAGDIMTKKAAIVTANALPKGTKEEVQAKEEAVTKAQNEYADAKDHEFKLIAAGISAAETARLQLNFEMKETKGMNDELIKAYSLAKAQGPVPIPSVEPKESKAGDPPSPPLPPKMRPTLITIKKELPLQDTSDDLETKNCGNLPKPKAACAVTKPESTRSCQIVKARVGHFKEGAVLVDWKAEDAWRKKILELIEDIFYVGCSPMVRREYVTNVNRVLKGYLLDFIPGTLPLETGTTNPIKLPVERPFWKQILKALEHCKKQNIKLRFIPGELVNYRETYRLVKDSPEGSFEEVGVEEMVEQAEEEYAFNWVIDNHWRMVATVMGICLPAYETTVPLITSKFYTHYTQDFLLPLNATWTSNADNVLLRVMFGEYVNKREEHWSRRCMEASFSDPKTRPPRNLLVNQLSEPNFFISGPLAGTPGIYVD